MADWEAVKKLRVRETRHREKSKKDTLVFDPTCVLKYKIPHFFLPQNFTFTSNPYNTKEKNTIFRILHQ